jgi:acyl carrier protein/pimeloyl-ACP methyl ester carboxylesterase
MVLQQAADSAPRAAKKAPAAVPATPKAADVTSKSAPSKPATIKTTVTPAPQSSPQNVLPKPAPAPAPAASGAGPVIAAPTTKADNPKIIGALQIISEESGLALGDLTDESNFADIGVDSLLSMVIGSRFREELGLDLDTDFSIFVDLPTVRQLKEFLGRSPTSLATSETEAQAAEEPSESALSSLDAAIVQPPAAVEAKAAIESATTVSAPAPTVIHTPEPMITEPKAPATAPATGGALAALQIVSEESGVALEDLTDDSNFADIGVDSLLSMVIGSRFREELNIDLDTDFSIFVDLPTVKDLKHFFASDSASASDSDMSSYVGVSSAEDSLNETPDETPNDSDAEECPIKLHPYCRPSTSVILQGIPKTAQKTLFLLPDGSGSSSSYVGVPRLKSDIAVIGLNCPYARDPENMNCTHIALMESYCNEIRRRQPKGPYHLGGWSSGGAFAYVCAETLVNQGEEVHSLIIIDAPVPQVMDRLPASFYEHCNDVGLFAGGAPDYLIPHFMRTVEVMMDYKVAPLRTKRMPKVGILWACGTVMDEKDAPKLKGMHFMVHKRTDFGPDGWDEVLPDAEFVINRAEGGNHFSLMVS